jgi:hypothetical protein
MNEHGQDMTVPDKTIALGCTVISMKTLHGDSYMPQTDLCNWRTKPQSHWKPAGCCTWRGFSKYDVQSHQWYLPVQMNTEAWWRGLLWCIHWSIAQQETRFQIIVDANLDINRNTEASLKPFSKPIRKMLKTKCPRRYPGKQWPCLELDLKSRKFHLNRRIPPISIRAIDSLWRCGVISTVPYSLSLQNIRLNLMMLKDLRSSDKSQLKLK